MASRIAAGIAAFCFAIICDAAAAGVLYDLGPEEGRTWQGAQAVSEYRAPRGFTWLGEGGREGLRRLQPDPLSEDFVRGRGEASLRFALDLDRGDQRVSLLLGDTGTDQRRLPRFYRQPVVVRIGSHEQVIDPAPDWPFRLLSLPDVGGPSFWDRYLASRFRWVDAVVAGGGMAQVEISPGWAAPLCAVHIAPGDEDAAGWRLTLQEARRAYFAEHGWQPLPDTRLQGASRPTARPDGEAYTLHSRHWMEEVVPATPPPSPPQPVALMVEAAPAEVEPVTLSITPWQDLSGIEVSVSDLTSAGGKVLPAESVAVGWVRYQDRPVGSATLSRVRYYQTIPYVVLPIARLDFPLAAEVTRRLWLTVTVPAGEPAGLYEGALTLRFAGVAPRKIPLAIKVRPVTVGATPGEAHFFYFHEPGAYDRVIHPGRKGASYERAFLRDSKMLARFGFSLTNLVLPPEEVRFRSDGEVSSDLSTLERTLALWRRAGVVPQDDRVTMVLLNLVERFGGTWHQVQGETGSSIRFSRRATDQERFRDFVAWVGREARARPTWPEFLFECGGELSNYRRGGQGEAWGKTVYGLLRQAGVKTALRGNGPVDLAIMERGLVDVAILNHRMIRSDVLARLRKKGIEIWLYNFGQHRFNFGVLAWAVGATRTGHEGFQVVVGEPFNDWDGLIPEWGTAQPTPEGPVPTMGLIQMAEGIEDYRYLRSLELRLAEMTDLGRRSETISRARAFLDGVRREVRIDLPENRGDRRETAPWPTDWWEYHQAHGWTPERLDSLRDEAAFYLLSLDAENSP